MHIETATDLFIYAKAKTTESFHGLATGYKFEPFELVMVGLGVC